MLTCLSKLKRTERCTMLSRSPGLPRRAYLALRSRVGDLLPTTLIGLAVAAAVSSTLSWLTVAYLTNHLPLNALVVWGAVVGLLLLAPPAIQVSPSSVLRAPVSRRSAAANSLGLALATVLAFVNGAWPITAVIGLLTAGWAIGVLIWSVQMWADRSASSAHD